MPVEHALDTMLTCLVEQEGKFDLNQAKKVLVVVWQITEKKLAQNPPGADLIRNPGYFPASVRPPHSQFEINLFTIFLSRGINV